MLKVGMFTSGYQRNPLEHCFMDAKEYGYDYIELWGGRPHAYAPDLKAGDINEVRRLIEKYEMIDQCHIGSMNLDILRETKAVNPKIKTFVRPSDGLPPGGFGNLDINRQI